MTHNDTARRGDIYSPSEGAPPAPLADWDPSFGTAMDEAAIGAVDDRGMEMFAKVVIGAAIVMVLAALVLAWPFIQQLTGGLS